jgi:molybdate transport system ATP-binding protein
MKSLPPTMSKRAALRGRPFISLQNTTFRLGDRLVFENTIWTLHGDEQWAIIGPNGSGKTLLADALRGRLPVIQGELRYHFRPTKGQSPEDAIGHVAFEDRKSEVHGTVIQSRWTSFEEEASLRVGEFLSFERVMEVNPFEVSSNHGSARMRFESRVRKAIRLLQIEQFLSRNLLTLSNGERQRVQLARALAQPLRLLILDEPYVGLDAAAREHFHRILERLLKTKMRVLLITARTEDLPRHVTHLLRVENCRVADAGSRGSILAAPRRSATTGKLCRDGRTTPALKGAAKPSKPEGVVESIVELRDVTVRYGASVILDKLTWTVKAGESWALLGPNGSGKTTLLSLIQGDHPQAYVNDIKVFGRSRGGESVWHLKTRIGSVSPELQLHFDEDVPVLDAVLSGFSDTIGLFESPKRQHVLKAQRWLSRFGLSEHSNSSLFSLSAGLQRMALLARALVKDPPLLILDEPCQGLDGAHRDLIVEHVDALVRSGSVSVIYVTHRQEEIPRSIRRVLQLRRRFS